MLQLAFVTIVAAILGFVSYELAASVVGSDFGVWFMFASTATGVGSVALWVVALVAVVELLE